MSSVAVVINTLRVKRVLTLVLLNPDIFCICKQCRSEEATDLDLHCLLLSMWICIHNLDQAIWLAENQNWVWHFNLFSRTRVNCYPLSLSGLIQQMTTWQYFFENRLWYFMQIVICLLRRQFVWNVKACFLGKIFQNVIYCNFYP